MGHTSFESGESSQMTFFASVISWESSYSTSMMSGSSSWFVTTVTVSWCFKFSVRHFYKNKDFI